VTMDTWSRALRSRFGAVPAPFGPGVDATDAPGIGMNRDGKRMSRERAGALLTTVASEIVPCECDTSVRVESTTGTAQPIPTPVASSHSFPPIDIPMTMQRHRSAGESWMNRISVAESRETRDEVPGGRYRSPAFLDWEGRSGVRLLTT